MGKPAAPEAPDPVETSAASTGTNISTALANSFMQNVSQYGPDGSSLEYDVTGNYEFTDPYTGQTYDVPMFSAYTSLSPEEQRIYDTNQATRFSMADLANDRMDFLGHYLGSRQNTNPNRVANYLYDLGEDRLAPRLAQQREQLEAQLANQGIGLGSEAYRSAMNDFHEAENDAYNSLLLNGYDKAWNYMQAERAQPINEISALMSGSQIALPNYGMNVPQTIPTTDNAAIITDIYNGELDAYNTQMSGYTSLMGGLFGLMGSAISDVRLKKDITPIGEAKGLPVYTFRYDWEPGTSPIRVGFMAQDVAAVHPRAVTSIGGYLTINYDQIPEAA